MYDLKLRQLPVLLGAELRELVGHTLSQVIAGVVFGILLPESGSF
jgi:acid phosphatase family membrane protein YuiD